MVMVLHALELIAFHFGWYQLVTAMSFTCCYSCQLPKAVVVCALKESAVLDNRNDGFLISRSHVTKQHLTCCTC